MRVILLERGSADWVILAFLFLLFFVSLAFPLWPMGACRTWSHLRCYSSWPSVTLSIDISRNDWLVQYLKLLQDGRGGTMRKAVSQILTIP